MSNPYLSSSDEDESICQKNTPVTTKIPVTTTRMPTTTTKAPITTTTLPVTTTNISCLLEGTRVKTPSGYTLIEQLRVGDILLSDFGKLTKISKIGRWVEVFEEEPYDDSKVVYKIPKGQYNAENDIFITRYHRFLDPVSWRLRLPYIAGLTLAKRSEIVRPNSNTYVLYHIRLENTHDNIVVNGGCVVESWKNE